MDSFFVGALGWHAFCNRVWHGEMRRDGKRESFCCCPVQFDPVSPIPPGIVGDSHRAISQFRGLPARTCAACGAKKGTFPMSAVQTVSTPVSDPVSAILAELTKIGAKFNDSKAASSALSTERSFQVATLARRILDLNDADRDAVQTAINTIGASPKHALRAFCKAIVKAADKITEGRMALTRQ